MPRRPVRSRLPGVLRKRSSRSSALKRAWSRRSDCTACTSWTARSAPLAEAMLAPETSCGADAQNTTQAAVSAPAARSECRRWRAATRVSRSTASVGRTSAATTTSTAPATVRSATVRPNVLRTVSTPNREEAPVVDRVERTVEGDEEADVEELHQHQQAERRPDHPREDAPGAGGQDDGQQHDDDPFERKPHEGAGREPPRLDRSDQGDPHDDEREQRERDGSGGAALASRSACGRLRAGAATATRRHDRTTRRAGRARRRGAARVRAGGRTSAAATVSVIPCAAATTLRQSRRGSGARIQPNSHPAARNA